MILNLLFLSAVLGTLTVLFLINYIKQAKVNDLKALKIAETIKNNYGKDKN